MIHATFVGLYAVEESVAGNRPVLVVRDGRIVDYNTAAGFLGVTHATPVIEALRLAPDALISDFEPVRHRRCIDEMQRTLLEWTPWLEIAAGQE